jgi:hypothetical protein
MGNSSVGLFAIAVIGSRLSARLTANAWHLDGKDNFAE